MINDADNAELDQRKTSEREVVAQLVWNFYDALVCQGFDEQQAMALTDTYLLCFLEREACG